ncbi:MAG: DUF3786 domain-containing protein [Candidatus Omnitrophica bacterium]|nr:DUF3786 domain-containing protein [Candidatus Omnitrophota bacterium]
MGYEVALLKAWSELGNITKDKSLSIVFLAEEYAVDLENQQVMSLSYNLPAKDYVSILILHYLVQKLKGLPLLDGEWISFKQLAGGQGYYSAFRKRVIAPIVKKYGSNPNAIYGLVKRFKAKTVQLADSSVVLEVFNNVPVLIELWRGDEEFGPEANVLFDKSIKDIFCTEDIVVLAGFVAYNI